MPHLELLLGLLGGGGLIGLAKLVDGWIRRYRKVVNLSEADLLRMEAERLRVALREQNQELEELADKYLKQADECRKELEDARAIILIARADVNIYKFRAENLQEEVYRLRRKLGENV